MPTGYTPIYRITHNDFDITGQFNDRCTQMRIDYATDDDDTALFTLDDRDWAIASPNVGDRIKIWLGYVEVGLAYMGSYEVSELHFTGIPKSIVMKCSATGQRSALKSQSVQNLENKTIAQIAEIIAGKAGMPAVVGSSVSDTNIVKRITNVSPQQLLAELRRHFGLVAKFTDDKLVIVGRDQGLSANDVVVPIVVFTQEHFGTWDVVHRTRAQYKSVKAAYVDLQDYVTKFVEESIQNPDEGATETFTPGRKFNNKQEAQAAAKAQAQALQRSTGQADIQLTKGDPWIRDQQRFLIRGMRDGVNGSYVTDMVSHTYLKDQGILTSIKSDPDSDGRDYEEIYQQATPEQLESEFIVPPPGGLIGSMFGLKPSAGDFINGINPFPR